MINAQAISNAFVSRLRHLYKAKVTEDMQKNAQYIIEECERQRVVLPEQIAYVLGTAWHESKLMPIKEIRAKPGSDVWRMQEKYWHTNYYGRGFVQLTWSSNYAKFSELLGVDLVSNPDLCLRVEYAAQILVIGMRDGLFTGRKLSDYFKEGKKPMWVKARRIVNAMFHAERVATYAKIAFLCIHNVSDQRHAK